MSAKIFGVGLSRTGTSTLINALGVLGFSAVHFPTTPGEFEIFDGAADTPVAANFEDLDKRFPHSRFIYTVRDLDSWLSSCRRFWAKRQQAFDSSALATRLHRRLYDTRVFEEAKFRAAYARHDARVRRYFAERPGDLFEFDICGGQGSWPPLCEFLRVAVPALPFPWANSGDDIDDFLIRLLHLEGEPAKVAEITGISAVHLSKLKAGSRFAEHDPGQPLNYDGGAEAAGIAVRVCNRYGGAKNTAARLKVPLDSLRAAHEFVSNRRRAQREAKR